MAACPDCQKPGELLWVSQQTSECWGLQGSQSYLGQGPGNSMRLPYPGTETKGQGSQCWKQEVRTRILGRQSLSDTLLPSHRSSGCFLETLKRARSLHRAGQLSAGWLWHDFPNLCSVKEDAISVNTQGKLRDPHLDPT